MQNAELRLGLAFRILRFASGFGGFDGRDKDRYQFFGLLMQAGQPCFGNSSALYQQLEPITSLVQLLQTALHLADKLGS